MQEEFKQFAEISESFGGGFWGVLSAIAFVVGTSVVGFVRWSIKRLVKSYEDRLDTMEERVGKVEQNQTEIKEILSSMMTAPQVVQLYERQSDRLTRFEDKMDAKLDKINDHLMNRPQNQRRGD